MQSYVGRDSKAHAARRLNAPVDGRISAARTNVIVCLVNISWSAEKRDDTCSKTVSVLLLPANNETEERANGVGDLFRCKFRKRMPRAAFFNSAGPECTRERAPETAADENPALCGDALEIPTSPITSRTSTGGLLRVESSFSPRQFAADANYRRWIFRP